MAAMERFHHENFGIGLSIGSIEEQKLVVPNFSARRSKVERNDCSQDGSILIAASVFLLVGVILLGSIQIGYMYYTKRELQKTADLAALTGVQSLWKGSDAAKTAAEKVAAQNFSSASVDAEPGNWVDGKFDTSLNPLNALQVVVGAPISPIVPFFGSGSINAKAQAVTDSVAQFSVGSRLLSFDSNGLLGQLLKPLGVDDSTLDVLDSSGVANVGIRPIDLLNDPRLGIPLSVFSNVLSPEALAQDTTVQIGSLLNVAGDIVGKSTSKGSSTDGLTDAITNLVGALGQTTSVPLFGAGGILSIAGGVDPMSALSTKISALDFFAATSLAAEVANSKNSANLDVEVPGVTVLATVVQPPSLAIGGPRTIARNSQIQLSLTLSSNLDIPLLGGLLSKVVSLQVPLHVDVATSQGELLRLCEPDLGNDKASIAVTTSVAHVCLFSGPRSGSCASQSGDPVDLVNVLNLIRISSSADASLGSSQPNSYVFTVGKPETVNEPDINLLSTDLVNQIIGNLNIKLLGALSLNVAGLKTNLGDVLKPLGSALGNVVSVLGLDLNQTDVSLQAVQCSMPHLVQ